MIKFFLPIFRVSCSTNTRALVYRVLLEKDNKSFEQADGLFKSLKRLLNKLSVFLMGLIMVMYRNRE